MVTMVGGKAPRCPQLAVLGQRLSLGVWLRSRSPLPLWEDSRLLLRPFALSLWAGLTSPLRTKRIFPFTLPAALISSAGKC